MAMYHFRLKSDKKPNGTKISAVKHVEYIDREGSFSHDEQWKENNKFVGNIITTAETSNVLGGKNALLYKTDEFGAIKNTERGLEVTENASLTTISIALMLADEAMGHKPLIISGSPEFSKKVLEIAVHTNLPISFQDNLLQNEFEQQKEDEENERNSFVANGGKIISKRPDIKPAVAPSHAKTVKDATKEGFRLPTLSERTMVYPKSRRTDVFLQADEFNGMDELARECNKRVRWDFSSERKRLAKLTAKKILENVTEAMEEESAVSHVEYINRERAFANRGGCIFHAHHLPKWAQDDPKIFFQAAEEYEAIGNRRYREIEFALPNELKTVEQYRQIIDVFIAKHLSDHYYAYAIHNKIGVMSDGQHHPHVHIMFSERQIDEVEQKQEREAKSFFLYPARKKKAGTEPSFEEKWKRGAPKARKWADKNFLTVLRADLAEIENEVLSRNDFSIRVDHRTLKAQKEEAERNGDTFLARLFSRVPEKYIGIISFQDDEDSKLERLKKFRGLRKQHFDMVMKIDAMTKEAEELEVKDAVQLSSTGAKSLMDSEEYKTQEFVSQYLLAMKNKMLTAVAEVNKWKRVIISQHDAEEQAKLEYMSKAERELWQKYFETLGQKKQLEQFLQTLSKPDESQKEELQAYEEVVAGVKAKIYSLFTASLVMKKSVEEIEQRLTSPECKNNILLVTHQILQANTYARKMLKRASEDLEKAVDALRNELFAQTMEEPQTSFKTREVYDLIRRQYFGLKKEYENTLAQKFKIEREVISPERAIFMAKNIFVRGEYKRLREEIRRYKKEEQRLAPKLLVYAREEKQFQSRDWTVFPRSTFLQQQYYLLKQRTMLELEKTRLDQIKLSLRNKQSELEKLCQEHEAARKIETIAVGILRKNYRFVCQLEEIETRAKELIPRMNHAQEQMNALEKRVVRDKVNTRYRVTVSDTLTNNQAASVIADAILNDPQVVQLVARSNGNNLEMEKDWELMSELDKDELLDKGACEIFSVNRNSNGVKSTSRWIFTDFFPHARGKSRFVVSVGSATAFLLFALLSLSAVFQIYLTINDGSQELSDNMANYAENFTLTAEQNRLEKVAQNRAEIIYQEIRFVQEDVDYLSCRVSDILKNPQNYPPRSLPISNYQKVTSKTPYVHFSPSLMKNNVTDDILAEIRLLSNIADDQKFLSDYYDAIFIGSEKGYTIMLHVMQNDDDITPLSKEPQINSYDPRERIWYKLGMAEKKSTFTEVYIGTKGTPCFSCAMPYYDAQGIAGILGVDVNLSSIQELVEKTATNEDETNFILGNNGEILFSTKKRGFLSFGGLNNDLRKLADEEISNVAKRMVAGESSVLPIKIEGNDYFIAFAPIPKLSWSFATIIDKNSMIQPTIDARNRNAERMENFRQSIVLMLLAFLTGAGIFMLILLKMFAKGSGKLAEKFSRPILELTDGVKEISDGNLDKKFDIKTANEIEDLAICMNAMTDELKKEMARVERMTAEKERTMTDILVAASIQRDMLPNMFPPFPQRQEFDIFAMMRATREVGGDFYDFYLIDDDKLALIIADIKGKGVPAALFMVIAKTLFKNFIMMIKNPEELSGAITIANDKLCENNEQNMSVTVFAAILEISTGKLTYVNAAHTSPLVYKKSEKIYSFLPSPKEKNPLGINNGLFFSTDTINFATGDKIFMYNNSVLKIIDENGNTFGKKNLAEALNKNISVSVTETINILDTEIKNFVGNKEQSDDITMVALEYFGAGIKEAKS